MNDPRDKILDAFLDEMLNERRPQKSSAEIVHNLRDSQASPTPARSSNIHGSDLDRRLREAIPAQQSDSSQPHIVPVNASSASRDSQWVSLLATAGLILTIMIGGIYLLNQDKNSSEVAQEKPSGSDTIAPRQQPNPSLKDDSAIVNAPQAPRVNGPEKIHGPAPLPNNPKTRITQRPDVPSNPDAPVLPGKFERTSVVADTPRTPIQMASLINERLQESWTAQGLRPAGDLEFRSWSNRLASRLIGRTLTADEMASIASLQTRAVSPGEVRRDLIEAMRAFPGFEKEFSDHWGKVLAWQILGISPGMDTKDPEMIATREYLSEAIANSEPMDAIAYRLLSAVGSTDTNADSFNPATNYLVGLRKRFGTPELSSAHVADVFLGKELQCLQCHDQNGSDGVAESEQRDFFEFHSFFAQLNIQAETPEQKEFSVTNRNYLPLGRQGRVEAPTQYRDTQGKALIAFPRLGDYRPGTNGFVAKVDRRSLLAQKIAGSEQFRETLVDHVWAGMLNLPMSGIDGNISPSLASLRETLAKQFAANDYNLNWLVMSIASCDAFLVGVGTDEQLSAHNPFLGEAPQFNIFYSRLENRRSAIQSLAIVARAYQDGDTKEATNAGLLARVDRANELKPNFILPFIPSKDSEWATSPRIAQKLERIAASKTLDNRQKVQHIIQSALGRPATPQETAQAQLIMQNSEDSRTALQDVWWSLLNSVDYKMPLAVR